VVPLAEHFTARFADRFGLEGVRLSDRVLAALQRFHWPGNVRELEHVVERLVALADGPLIDEDPFDAAGGADPTDRGLGLKQRLAGFERALIAAELRRSADNQSETARRLGISRPALIDKLKKHGLK
jgi:two-component system response regulator AtoC